MRNVVIRLPRLCGECSAWAAVAVLFFLGVGVERPGSAQGPMPSGDGIARPAFTPTVGPLEPTVYLPLLLKGRGTQPAPGLDVLLTLREQAGVPRTSEPVTSGFPLPAEADITDIGRLRLTDAAGQPVAAQFVPLARWGGAPNDTSRPIKWVLADFRADVAAYDQTTYRLQAVDPAERRSDSARGITVTETETLLMINNGMARFLLSKTAFGLFEQVYQDRDGDGVMDDPLLAAPGQIAAIADGTVYRTDASPPTETTVELDGPLHTVVRFRGDLRSEGGEKLLAYTARLHFYADHPLIRVLFTVWNDNPMVNVGGQPDILDFGSPNTVLFDDLSLRLVLSTDSGSSAPCVREGMQPASRLSGCNPVGAIPDLPSPPTYTLAGGPGEVWSGPLTSTAELYQDSSGGPQWNHEPDNAANTFRGFEARSGGVILHPACGESDSEETCRSLGWAALTATGGGIAVGVRNFWQNYPKSIAVAPDGTLTVGLFPGRYGRDFELRVGEQKTHEILLYFGRDALAERMVAAHNPLRAWAASDYYLTEARVLDRAVPRRADAFPDFEGYVDAAILYPTMNLFLLRDGAVGSDWVYAPRPESWGWRNFGDTIAEDETNADSYPVFTNQQYDHPWAFILQAIRSLDDGGGRADLWWQLAEAGAYHQADIDIIHSPCTGRPYEEMVNCMDTEQGPPYPVGWAMGGRLTNQWHAWPVPDVHRHALIDYWSGGIRGMLYYYYLTGDGVVADAWRELAENARWRVENSPCDPDCGPGYANGNPGEADAREAAYGLQILTDAYDATGDEAYLLAARRVISDSHPDRTWFGQAEYHPDPAISPAGKTTSPWGLAMIMQSLGHYLDVVVEWQGAPDPLAQDSLLRYAELLASWWRLGEDEPACYLIAENGGCAPDRWNFALPDGMAWALLYDDGRADRTLWENVAADAWQKSESEPWGPDYPKGRFLTAKTQMMLAIQGVAWMQYALDHDLAPRRVKNLP